MLWILGIDEFKNLMARYLENNKTNEPNDNSNYSNNHSCLPQAGVEFVI